MQQLILQGHGPMVRQLFKRSVAAIGVLIVLLLAGARFNEASAAPRGSHWGPGYFPNFVVTTHEGKKVKFYDDLIKNKIVIVNFIYTNCPDICPLTTARMAEIQQRLGDDVGKKYFIYSISLDTKHDTPEAMRKYAEAFDIGPGWLFITGNAREIGIIRYKLGERSRSLSEHRTDMVVGNDILGSWRRTSAFDDFDRAVLAIHSMDPDWIIANRKRKKGKGRISANYNSSARRIPLTYTKQTGQALFYKGCASCHTIGKGKKVGPDLKGVTARRSRKWLEQFIMHPDETRKSGDMIAKMLRARFPGVLMPYLGVSKTDVADILTYIDLQTKFQNSKSDNDGDASRSTGG